MQSFYSSFIEIFQVFILELALNIVF